MSNYSTLESDPFSIDDDDVIQPDTGVDPSATTKSPGPAAGANTGIGSQAYTPSLHDVAFDEPSKRKPKKTYTGGPLSLNYYRQYFDLDTSEFIQHIWDSMQPFSKVPEEDFDQVGDLYGAVWLTATLVFLLFFCNSFAEMLSGWLSHRSQSDTDKKLHIDYFRLLLSSINLLYGYLIVVPAVLWAVLRFYLGIVRLIPLSRLVSIYGYSNVLWVPAALLSIFRGLLANNKTLDTVLKWVCIGLGAVLSGAGIFTKLDQYFKLVLDDTDQHKKQAVVLIGLLVLAHIGFAIGVKVCFFGNL